MTPHALVKKARATSLEPEAWYFVIKSNNGEIVATSEMYTRKADAERGVEDLWSIIGSKVFEVKVEDE